MGQARRPGLWAELQMEDLYPIEIRQRLVPVGWIPFQPPHHTWLQALGAEGAGARIHRHTAQIVIVLLQRLFPYDHIEASGERPQEKAARLPEMELHGALVAGHHVPHGIEET